jgi:hypothetical protein
VDWGVPAARGLFLSHNFEQRRQGVLDGARAVESTDKGTLKLYYERRDEKVLLNDQARFGLHEML